MRLSELADATGVSIPTIKFYLRQGLLPAGRPASARQADYTDAHVQRIALIRALVEVGGLSLAAVRDVLDALSGPDGVRAAVGTAHRALGPDPGAVTTTGRARRALGLLGWDLDPDSPAGRQLESALAAVEAVGLAPAERRLRAYAAAAMAVAREDVADVDRPPLGDPVRYVVLGTILYEPLLLALRRLAQERAYREARAGNPGFSPGA